MTDFSALLQQGVANAWLFIPSAILLGALHGLEPGHSKTMMAAFIVAIRGTVKQAVLLGLAATISHTSVVWLIAMGGMYVSQKFTAESAEPWFQLISAIIILATAAWMFWRTWRGEKLWEMEQEEEHGHGHHDHDETRIIDTGHGSVELSIFEEGSRLTGVYARSAARNGKPATSLWSLTGAQVHFHRYLISSKKTGLWNRHWRSRSRTALMFVSL
jgi:nickel/cobalt exporter